MEKHGILTVGIGVATALESLALAVSVPAQVEPPSRRATPEQLRARAEAQKLDSIIAVVRGQCVAGVTGRLVRAATVTVAACSFVPAQDVGHSHVVLEEEEGGELTGHVEAVGLAAGALLSLPRR
jgi:hypothetical protein